MLRESNLGVKNDCVHLFDNSVYKVFEKMQLNYSYGFFAYCKLKWFIGFKALIYPYLRV